MVSRGRNSLQLVFVLTKAFIAKVQELTSLGRQEGDKRGPLETQHKHTHSLFSHSYTHTQMTTTPSGFAHFLSLFHTAHNTHCTMVYHACTLLYGVRRGHFNAQNRWRTLRKDETSVTLARFPSKCRANFKFSENRQKESFHPLLC